MEALEKVEQVVIELVDVSKEPSRCKSFVRVDTGSVKLKLESVYYLPDPYLNTVSCMRLEQHGISTLVSGNKCFLIVRQNSKCCTRSNKEKRVRRLTSSVNRWADHNNKNDDFDRSSNSKSHKVKSDVSGWHSRMGHSGHFVIQKMLDNQAYKMIGDQVLERTFCDTCVYTKSAKQTHIWELAERSPSDIIYNDVFRPFSLCNGWQEEVFRHIQSYSPSIFKSGVDQQKKQNFNSLA